MCSLRKIIMRLRGTKFCTSSTRFAPSFVRQPNGPKYTKWCETHQNISFGSNGVDWVCLLRKNPMRLRGTKFCTSSARFAPSFVRHQTVPNAPKWYEMQKNVSLGSNGVDRVRSLQKTPTRLRGTNFCTSSARFPSSIVR